MSYQDTVVTFNAPTADVHSSDFRSVGYRFDAFCKRAFDIVSALFAILFFGPLLIIIAVMVKGLVGGQCIYRHRRVGRHGLPFQCYKFRSMLPDSDRILETHLRESPEAALEWQATHKLRRDPRITPFGRFLRATSLDELPQLFNILRGDMSCVGPRPIVFAELERYGPSASLYFRVRPGLTGLWQVSGRSRLSYAERVAMDRYYVSSRSMLVDLSIIVRTVPAVMRLAQTS